MDAIFANAMQVGDYLKPDCVLLLEEHSKETVLKQLSGVLTSATGVPAETIEAAILQREKMMSTGIGHGLAIPHVRMTELNSPVLAVGVSREGIGDYESLDNKPVHIVVLIGSPAGQHEMYIRLLARVAEVLKQPDIRQAIVEAEDAEAIFKTLTGGAT